MASQKKNENESDVALASQPTTSSGDRNLPFDVIPSENYLTIKFSGKMNDSEVAKQFENIIPKLLTPPKNIIINCEHLSSLSPNWMRGLVRLNHVLKNVNMQMRLIAVQPKVEQELKNNGVNTSLKVSPSLRAALSEFGLINAKTLDVNFINPFLVSTINVLKVQCSTEAKAGVPYKKAPTEKYSGDISGVIGLVSEAFSGSVVISFSEKTFLEIISRMLGEKVTQISKEIEDGAGELTNIIFGQTKVLLNEKGYGIKTAIPSVVTGTNHSVLQMTKGPRVVIPFETDVGPFFVEVCIAEEV